MLTFSDSEKKMNHYVLDFQIPEVKTKVLKDFSEYDKIKQFNTNF